LGDAQLCEAKREVETQQEDQCPHSTSGLLEEVTLRVLQSAPHQHQQAALTSADDPAVASGFDRIKPAMTCFN
jgi:hypothetical protein